MKAFTLFTFLILMLSAKNVFSSEMIEVPAGKFVMGDEADNGALPQQDILLQEFSIDRFEVTQEEYARLFPEFIFCPAF